LIQEGKNIRLRTRHKLMISAAAAGALLVGIPLGGMLREMQQDNRQIRESLSHYEELQSGYHSASIYVLTGDALAGEELTEDMICRQQIQSTGDLSAMPAPSQEELIGKRLKVSLAKGTALSQDLLYEGEPVAEDERRVELTQTGFPQTLKEDELVDIRIVFPDGEDFLVVGHKRVYQIISDSEGEVQAVQLRLTEEELLRYQAACVDVTVYEDARLYALQYTGEFQSAGQAYYPVNEAVFDLLQWDPNIVELFTVEAEQERRSQLETNLAGYLTRTAEQTQKETAEAASQDSQIEEGTDKEPLALYTGLPQES
jgi:hypothetical protein